VHLRGSAYRPLNGYNQKTIGADKNYDTKGFVAEMRRLGVTPHVAQNTARSGGSAIDSRTIRHEGYAKSIHARRGIEKVFGWIKAFCGLRQFKLRGQETVCVVFGLHVIAYNLIRLGNMLIPTAWRRHVQPEAQRCAQMAAAGPPKQSKCDTPGLSERLKRSHLTSRSPPAYRRCFEHHGTAINDVTTAESLSMLKL
jgi:hypothetical protein